MNGRKAREHRAAHHAKTTATLTAMAAAVPVLIGTAGGQDVYQAGPGIIAVPALLDAYPPDLKNALDRRRRAGLTGRCDCGAVRQLTRKGRLQFDHGDDCDASDPRIEDIATGHGMVMHRSVFSAVAGGR